MNNKSNKIVIFNEKGARIHYSVNVEDYKNEKNCLINPQLPKGIPPHHWKLVNGQIEVMNDGEKKVSDLIDRQKKILKQSLMDKSNDYKVQHNLKQKNRVHRQEKKLLKNNNSNIYLIASFIKNKITLHHRKEIENKKLKVSIPKVVPQYVEVIKEIPREVYKEKILIKSFIPKWLLGLLVIETLIIAALLFVK